ELPFVDGAAAQLKIDEDVVVDRGGFAERCNVFRLGVHHRNEIGDVLEIPQGLDAAGGGARADGDQELGRAANRVNALFVVRRSDGAFHKRNIVRAFDDGAGSFGEIGDFDGADNGKEFVLAVQQAQLATVAGSELPNGNFGFARGSHLRPPTCQKLRQSGQSGKRVNPCRRSRGRIGSGRNSPARTSCSAPSRDISGRGARRVSGAP